MLICYHISGTCDATSFVINYFIDRERARFISCRLFEYYTYALSVLNQSIESIILPQNICRTYIFQPWVGQRAYRETKPCKCLKITAAHQIKSCSKCPSCNAFFNIAQIRVCKCFFQNSSRKQSTKLFLLLAKLIAVSSSRSLACGESNLDELRVSLFNSWTVRGHWLETL